MSSKSKSCGRGFQGYNLKKGHAKIAKKLSPHRQADKRGAQVEGDTERGIDTSHAVSEVTLFREVLDRYGRDNLPKMRSQDTLRSLIKHLKNKLGCYPLAAITPSLLAEYRDERRMHVSTGTVRRALSLVGCVLNVATKDWGIALPHGNPVSQLRLPQPSRSRERRLLPGEEQWLFNQARTYGGEIHGIIGFALASAMRRNEIASMRWQDVDFNRHILRIPGTNTMTVRTIPLSATAEAILQQLPRRSDGRVFGMCIAGITRAFTRVVRRARDAYVTECKNKGTEPNPRFLTDLRFHDLRYEAVARLFELGLSAMQVSRITGHKSLQMLLRFTHLRVEDLAALLR